MTDFAKVSGDLAWARARKWLISAKMAEINHSELCNFLSAAAFK
jgi:hypothetical protein